MRRFLGGISALICVGLLTSCALFPSGRVLEDPKQTADAQMKQISAAVKNHDASALKKLFSPLARDKAENLDDGLKYFFSIFSSRDIRWKSRVPSVADSTEHSKRVTEYFGNYSVSSQGQKYELYFAYFSVNEFQPNNVGVYALGAVPSAESGYTSSGHKKPFNVWASEFGIDENDNTATGRPGIYVPQK